MSGAVLALAFGPDGLLYAGSRFSTADGVAANGIARWDCGPANTDEALIKALPSSCRVSGLSFGG
jgi:hypothetical protein